MNILVPLAEGFEEIEAVTIVDVLRRAELEVCVAGLEPGPCRGSRGVVLQPDALLAEVDLLGFDALVLPGGMGGTLAMRAREDLVAAVGSYLREGKWVGAICAAPLVLAAAGVIDGVEVTSHPSVVGQLGGALERDERVVWSGRLVTSQGPGTALEFALGLVGAWVSEAKAAELGAAMLLSR